MGTSLISNCLRELKKLRPTVTKQQHRISAHFLHRHEAVESGVGNAFRGGSARLQAEQGAAATDNDRVTTIHFDDVIDIGSGVAGIDRGPGVTEIKGPEQVSAQAIDQQLAGTELLDAEKRPDVSRFDKPKNDPT